MIANHVRKRCPCSIEILAQAYSRSGAQTTSIFGYCTSVLFAQKRTKKPGSKWAGLFDARFEFCLVYSARYNVSDQHERGREREAIDVQFNHRNVSRNMVEMARTSAREIARHVCSPRRAARRLTGGALRLTLDC